MRKLLLCVPMISLLLAACGGGVQGSEAEQLALLVRGEYLAMTSCSMEASITADYGQRVYQYELTARGEGEEMTLTLTAPETVAGVTARLDGGTGLLEYDGVSVETGPLDGDGLTPMSALPALLEAARSGYIRACSLEDQEDGSRLLRMDCGQAEGQPGTGTETSLWFDPGTYALVRGEVAVEGFRVILCECSNFTFEKQEGSE